MAKKSRRRSSDEEAAFRISDDDGGTDSAGDICERCECPRDAHEDGGECICGKCRKFKDS